ncbi:hypothetical protein BDN72DRAFT_861200 [Pluteus cervinus]|uniref:Uncharacterized protein n=1 Tax=Pluteus cervinus TaxID=181527 RepID=A0ACD3AGN5_9AGAR|nr:hypothetical protein BDN72DRAFT_861200 [Pluteus cervinus]
MAICKHKPRSQLMRRERWSFRAQEERVVLEVSSSLGVGRKHRGKASDAVREGVERKTVGWKFNARLVSVSTIRNANSSAAVANTNTGRSGRDVAPLPTSMPPPTPTPLTPAPIAKPLCTNTTANNNRMRGVASRCHSLESRHEVRVGEGVMGQQGFPVVQFELVSSWSRVLYILFEVFIAFGKAVSTSFEDTDRHVIKGCPCKKGETPTLQEVSSPSKSQWVEFPSNCQKNLTSCVLKGSSLRRPRLRTRFDGGGVRAGRTNLPASRLSVQYTTNSGGVVIGSKSPRPLGRGRKGEVDIEEDFEASNDPAWIVQLPIGPSVNTNFCFSTPHVMFLFRLARRA